MIPIFVINLRRSPERMASMAGQLAELGLTFERVEGIDGQCLSPDLASLYDPEAARRFHGRELGPGEIAVSLTHIGIYRTILDRKLPRAIIFEDDLIIDPKFLDLFKNLDNLPSDWELVKFCHKWGNQKRWGRHKINRMFQAVGFRSPVAFSGAYLINPAGIEKLMAFAFPIRFASDGLTGRFKDTGVNLYGIVPQCISQNNFPSLVKFSWD